MSEYLLSAQGDRVAMAHSVEGRYPFLDHRVIEFANQLPPTMKVRGLQEKFILRQAVQDLLPQVIWQRPKRPYRAPIHRSFFPDGEPLPWVAEMLAPAAVAANGVFRETAVAALQKKLARFGFLSESDEMGLAGILSTQLFFHHFINNYQPRPALSDNDRIKWVQKEGIVP
jgi:asparagine synthase (glutamine-hydrolysing)